MPCQSVAWVPLDAIGQAYVDWILSDDELPSVVNVVHPRPVAWEAILRGMRSELGVSLPLVSLQEWVSKVEDVINSSSLYRMAEVVGLYGHSRWMQI